ncbi:hypothetical protein GYMLUDRAFT_264708 [Collybiopsis luxurians FD-317 M1]|uniref:Unplaced genomic scaffold GYMLUscaffold_68, whole genome shotgun sequence n=1 Tax=Collybiopsis luxurians FD-317 M1 TaxID=944289 RepID=A0A0D0C921_9AGAR|nr:hypothetical protein GYMLUDRAFT_264708 [Collybiopsis luxurians FD-317 M1]
MAVGSIDRPELPLEIVELIIEHVCQDKKTIKTASLVCQVWRTAAFPYMLHDVLISEEADYGRLKKLCDRFPRLPTYHLRSIVLRPGNRLSSEMSVAEAFRSFAKLFEDKRWELNRAASELPVMPRVTSMKWVLGRDVRHSIVVGPTISRYLSLLPSLQRLTIKARFEDLHELELFLGLCCSQLKSLTFQGIWFRKNRSRPLSLGQSSRVYDLDALEKLAFERTRSSDPPYDQVVDLLLLFMKNKSSLQALRVRYDFTMSPTSLERLLQKSTDTLNSLVIEPIGVADNPLWGHACRPFARIGPSMQSLTLGIPTTTPGGPTLTNSAPFEVLDFFRFVQVLPPLPHITAVSIVFRIQNEWDASEIWGPSTFPERNMKASWHRFLPWLASQMPSLNLLVFFIKFKTKFDESDIERFLAFAKAAVPPLRPGINIQLQWILESTNPVIL